MAIYDLEGNALSKLYNLNGEALSEAYDLNGNLLWTDTQPQPQEPDYSNYSYFEQWASKGIRNTQGFDIYDGKVFWVSKQGNSSIPADCYVFALFNGSQALSKPTITIYSGHGNNLCFDFPLLYADSAYTPHVYINRIANDFLSATLEKTLYISDGSIDCDACIDETDKTILWTLGHTASPSDTSAPFLISKWDLTELTDNGDGTYTPSLLQTVETPRPENSGYYQGCKFHDGVLWYANGYAGTSTQALIFGVDPDTGEVLHTIDCQTTAELEGVAWVEDENAVGGYALYVGFAGMALRKYTFGAKEAST